MFVEIATNQSEILIKCPPQKRTIFVYKSDNYDNRGNIYSHYLQFPTTLWILNNGLSLFFLREEKCWLPPLPAINIFGQVCLGESLNLNVFLSNNANIRQIMKRFWETLFMAWYLDVKNLYADAWKLNDDSLLSYWKENDIFQLPLIKPVFQPQLNQTWKTINLNEEEND